MLKNILIATIIFAIGTVVGANSVKADEIIQDQAIHTVFKMQSGAKFCSAVAINVPMPEEYKDRTAMLTAAHCIDTSKRGGYLLTSDDKPIAEFGVVLVSNKIDLAVIAVDDPTFKPKLAVVADKMIAVEGDDVWAVGYTYGRNRTTTKGLLNEEVTMMTPLGNLETFQIASPNIDQGNSGGGLFQKNGDMYELIGIASMKGPSVFTNMFVTLENLIKFLGVKNG